MKVEVLVEIGYSGIDKTFTYLVPKELEKSIQIGKRVKVPFGKNTIEGFVINFSDESESEFKLKEILEIIDEEEVLTKELLKLGEYIQEKTFAPLIYCYQTMLPRGIKASYKFKIGNQKEKYLILKKENLKNYKPTQKGTEILELFEEKKLKKEIADQVSASAVNTLVKYNILEIIEEEKKLEDINIKKNNFELNSIQKENIEKIIEKKQTFEPFLLHGVTGSGKTEVYLNVIEEIIEDKQVVMLVPEISLTPQMVDVFQKRFGNKVAVLHSGLTDVEKYNEWNNIKTGRVSIVVGARSAVFAPFENLGLIIVDEEHSLTYKQENNPKYNTIDVAIWRAKYHKCPLILGSATPSIESYTRAKMGIYTLLKMPTPINNLKKQFEIIDMREEMRTGSRYLSKSLLKEIKERLEKQEQIILFLNRRGYTTTVVCRDCGEAVQCPNCEISLTYHKHSNSLKCHYCEHSQNFISLCKHCGSKNLRHFGLGTQKLEEEIESQFPNAKIIRMDNDTTRQRGSHGKIINDFSEKKYDILIGTQMISKGLDFQNVTLVGVISGDASLNMPDFRSAERTFQLINQVAGRAGRFEKQGKVIVQCFNPDHYSIIDAIENNYEDFYNKEIEIRKKLEYPPFINLTLLKIYSTDFDFLIKEAEKMAEILKKNKKLKVLGPTVSSIIKINKKYNVSILIKHLNKNDIKKEIDYITELSNLKKIKIDIDINPLRI